MFETPDLKTHEIQSYLIHDMQGKIRNKEIGEYFELRALEAIFKSSLVSLKNSQRSLLPQIEAELVELNKDVTQEKLKNLLVLKNELTMYSNRGMKPNSKGQLT